MLNGQNNMELRYRRFKDLRTNVTKKKSTIQPYDSSNVCEKFKKEYLQNLTKIKEQIDEITEQNQQIIDHNREEQDIIDLRKKKLEDRMIAILSFNTYIMLYGRALETWQANAKSSLADPIDDLETLENLVEKEEQICESLQKSLENEGTFKLEEVVMLDQNKIDEYLQNQLVQKNHLLFKKLKLEKERQSLKPIPRSIQKINEKKEVIDFKQQNPSNRYHIDIQNLPTDITDYEKFIQQSTTINISSLIQKQQQLRKRQADLALEEEKFNNYYSENSKKMNEKTLKLNELTEEFHERTHLLLQIDRQTTLNSRLKADYAKLKDDSAEMRREFAFLDYLRDANSQNQEETKRLQEKMEQMKTILKKRKKHFAKREKNLLALQDDIENATKEKDLYEATVIQMENKVFQAQMRLNLKLKEAQILSNYVPSEDVINEKGKRIPRLEEISKVVDLVSIEKTEKDL